MPWVMTDTEFDDLDPDGSDPELESAAAALAAEDDGEGGDGYEVEDEGSDGLSDDDERILRDDQADRVWILQERMGDRSHKVYSCLPPGFETTFVVNGLCQPILRMRPGEVQRWRFVNASRGGMR